MKRKLTASEIREIKEVKYSDIIHDKNDHEDTFRRPPYGMIHNAK